MRQLFVCVWATLQQCSGVGYTLGQPLQLLFGLPAPSCQGFTVLLQPSFHSLVSHCWQVHEYWSYCGEIESMDLMTFPDTGRFRGIVFVTFTTQVGARGPRALFSPTAWAALMR